MRGSTVFSHPGTYGLKDVMLYPGPPITRRHCTCKAGGDSPCQGASNLTLRSVR